MLVLERKADESIIITHGDDTISIKIGKCTNGTVKLIFDAPKKYIILREELVTNSRSHN